MKNQKGQILVETVFVMVLIIFLFLGIFQITHLSIIRFVSFDAAHSACRASIVNKDYYMAGLYVFTPHNIGKIIIPTSINVKSQNNINIATISYLQKIMFPNAFSLFKIKFVPGNSICYMVKPPEDNFLDKSYPDAKND